MHSVVRDPPAWNGGVETVGKAGLRPRFWHHVCVTRAGGELTLFLDGRVVGRESIGRAVLDFDYFRVGRLNANPKQSAAEARQMVGCIDELVIFNRALVDEEVRILANGKVPGE